MRLAVGGWRLGIDSGFEDPRAGGLEDPRIQWRAESMTNDRWQIS